MGWRYINSDRMMVHHRKQENDTSLNTGFSYIALRYITDVKWGVHGPCLVALEPGISHLTSRLVVDRKRIFVILPKAERGLLKKVHFCRNTERTERSCFCQKGPLLQKETLSAGKSFHSCLIISKFWLIKTIPFLISAKLTTQGFST